MFEVKHYGGKEVITRLFEKEKYAKQYQRGLRLDSNEHSLLREFEYKACDDETRKKFGELGHSTPANIIIRDPAHFSYTINFAMQNDLVAEFGKAFTNLMHLLRNGGEIWPDGWLDPGFGWSGCGMVGGFIFHRLAREWSIHT